MVVVIAIMAIIVAFIAPRMTALKQTEGRYAADQVADLMRMWAYRNSMMTQQVGLWCDPERKEIRLMIRDIDPRRPDDGPVWQEDRLTIPVRLPEGTTLTEVYIDGAGRNTDDWFVQSNADGSRPRFELGVSTGNSVTRLLVEPYSTTVVRSDDRAGGASRQRVDLDREGARDIPW
jgi:type II secretory pathway pseudopilin PulG